MILAKTADRSVLGCMNYLAAQYECAVRMFITILMSY